MWPRFLHTKIYFYTLMALFLLASCKSKKAVADGKVNTGITARKIIENHYKNQLSFNTLSGRLKIEYSDGYTNQGFNVSLRMKKDEAIWISAPLGVLKAYITPDRVQFYNKLEGEYFEGDFSYLSDLLGADLDFKKVQNLLIGNAVLDLREQKFSTSILDGKYGLKPKEQNELYKILFFLEPKNFKIANQEISQPWNKRFLSMQYSYQRVNDQVLPNKVTIQALTEDGQNNIDLDYKNVELNRNLNFPFRIPKGYKEIVLK
ncbi:MAG: DUF4292 domain-containing protein [Croceitalea sp.]|nr:DUF4292 domain-containing protein [Croceitalea sp.]